MCAWGNIAEVARSQVKLAELCKDYRRHIRRQGKSDRSKGAAQEWDLRLFCISNWSHLQSDLILCLTRFHADCYKAYYVLHPNCRKFNHHRVTDTPPLQVTPLSFEVISLPSPSLSATLVIRSSEWISTCHEAQQAKKGWDCKDQHCLKASRFLARLWQC